MKSNITAVLEGLNTNRHQIHESQSDLPICHRSRELQKVLSDAFARKYFSVFKAQGAESMGVEVYTHEDSDDEDVIRIPDVLYEITLYIAFDIRARVNVKTVNTLISSTLKKYPKFVFDKMSKQFYCTVENPDDIFDVLDILKKDGAAFDKLVSTKYVRDIESEVASQLAEWEAEKKEQEAEYRRDVLGTY